MQRGSFQSGDGSSTASAEHKGGNIEKGKEVNHFSELGGMGKGGKKNEASPRLPESKEVPSITGG